MGLRKLILTFFVLAAGSLSVDIVGNQPADPENSSNVAGYYFVGNDSRAINESGFEVLSFEDLLDERFLPSAWLQQQLANDLVDYAKNFIGTRYRIGAKGPKAFDCSGFRSYIFRKFGYSLGGASHIQGLQGESVELSEARPGDLIFFSGRRAGSRIGHVGMVVDADSETGVVRFIHASTGNGVRIDNYPDGGYYSRRFIEVRRVIGKE